MKQKKFFSEEKVKKIKNKLLERYNLSCENNQLGTSGFFDTTKCLDKNKIFYILKIRKEKSKATKDKFLKEIAINKLLSERGDVNQSIAFPKYLNSDITISPEWFIYHYIEGVNTGGWYNFDEKKVNKIYKKFPEIINVLSTIPKPDFKLRTNRRKDIAEEFNNYSKLLKKFFTGTEIKKGNDIINEYKELLDSTKLVVTHGDLHPANIILTNQNKLTVIDWSDVKLDNKAFDFTFLWFELWNRPKEQEYFFNKIFKNNDDEDFKILFLINLIRLTPKMLEVVNDGKVYFDKLKKENKFSKGNINDYKVLEDAAKYYISNYKKIIKT